MKELRLTLGFAIEFVQFREGRETFGGSTFLSFFFFGSVDQSYDDLTNSKKHKLKLEMYDWVHKDKIETNVPCS